MTKIAIVILNWNGRDMMRRFLPSVIKGSTGAEIIVADNGSTDGSMEMLGEEFPTVGQIRFDRNYGFAEGYNKALKEVEAEYYVLLNSDIETPEGWLSPLVEYMDAHPEVAACQPKLRSEWKREDFEYAGAAGGYIDAWGYPYCRGRLMASVEKDEGQYDTIANVLWATGACLFIRSRDWHEVGGLDGRFFAHQEEIDLCWRLRSRGRGIVCVPQSMVFHLGGGTLPKGNPKKDFLNFRNNMLLLYKNLPDERFKRVMRVRRILDDVAALQCLLTGRWDSFVAILNARVEFHRIKHEYDADREKNLSMTVLQPVPEQAKFSLLWKYYIKGVRKFSDL